VTHGPRIAVLEIDFVAAMLAPGFTALNPGLAHLQPQIAECQRQYDESRAKTTCGCGGDSRSLFPCIDAVLAELEGCPAQKRTRSLSHPEIGHPDRAPAQSKFNEFHAILSAETG
jgi:hypothetical protein